MVETGKTFINTLRLKFEKDSMKEVIFFVEHIVENKDSDLAVIIAAAEKINEIRGAIGNWLGDNVGGGGTSSESSSKETASKILNEIRFTLSKLIEVRTEMARDKLPVFYASAQKVEEVEPKVEPKVETKVELKVEPKVETKVETKANRYPRISAAQKTILEKIMGAEATNALKDAFKKFINGFSDAEFKKMGGFDAQVERFKNKDNQPPVEEVESEEEDDLDVDVSIVAMGGEEFLVTTEGKVYQEMNGIDKFLGFVGVGKFKNLKV